MAKRKTLQPTGPKPKLDSKIERILGLSERISAESDVWRKSLQLAPAHIVVTLEANLVALHKITQARLEGGKTQAQEELLGDLLKGMSEEQRETLLAVLKKV